MTLYYLFAGHRYYPNGGWSDYRGTFGKPARALEKFREIAPELMAEGGYGKTTPSNDCWYEIVNSDTLKIENRGNYGDSAKDETQSQHEYGDVIHAAQVVDYEYLQPSQQTLKALSKALRSAGIPPSKI